MKKMALYLIAGIVLLGHGSQLLAPDGQGIPPHVVEEEWDDYVIGRQGPLRVPEVQVIEGAVYCNGVKVPYSGRSIETVVTLDEELYINGQRVEVPSEPAQQELKKKAAQRQSGSSHRSCVIQ